MPTNLGPFEDEENQAFRQLINSASLAAVLALPRARLLFSVDTDASDYQVGEVLFEIYPDGQRQPVGFRTRSLSFHEKNYLILEKECLAVVWALQTLRPYL